MAGPDFKDLHQVHINPELLSRGSGERIPLQEAVVYDFMPRILGSRFMTVAELNRARHFFSGMGSFMMMDEAYNEVAEEELKVGNLTLALDAYKKRLHAAVGFIGAMSLLGNGALLNSEEVNRLNLQERFGALERELVRSVVSQNISLDLPKYIEWLNSVRGLERDSHQFNRQYFSGVPKHPDNPDIKGGDPDYWDTSMVRDKELGTKLRDTYVQMQRYKDAAWISKEIGDETKQFEYEKLAETDPKENPRYNAIMGRILDDYNQTHPRPGW